MKLIAHRGNLAGPDKNNENTLSTINKVLELGYDIELDVRLVDGIWYLGHDNPDYQFDPDFLKDNRIWTHCKNYQALNQLITEPKINCFWHQEDDYTITSKGYIWAYPGKISGSNSICVMPEWNSMQVPKDVYGICSDYVGNEELFSVL